MPTPNSVIAGSYELGLVLLSIVLAILASYAALDLTGRIAVAAGRARLVWLGGGGVAMGTGIWSMHYIGMLAFQLPVEVRYDWRIVLVSLAAAMFASGVALFAVDRPTFSFTEALIGGSVMGLGVASMHYIGMEAMRLRGMCVYSPGLVMLSVVLAVLISSAAIILVFRFREEGRVTVKLKIAGSLVLGLAIPVMHYVGMAAVTFKRTEEMPDFSHAVDISSLGLGTIVIITVTILGVTILTAVADRKLSERTSQLELSETRFRRLIDSNLVGVMVADASGRILEANNAFLDMIRYTKEDLAANQIRWDVLTPPEYRHVSERLGRELATAGVAAPVETEHIRKDGSRLPVLVGLASLDNGDCKAIGITIDLTELKRAQSAAEAANRAKTEFLANMSHEIRTPMNAILGMIELVLDSPLATEQGYQLSVARAAAESLLGIVDGILNLSKIEAGKLDLDVVEFDVREVIEGAVKVLSLQAHEKDLELTCDLANDVPEIIVGDPTRLRQILVNLIGNAIKFTERGEIALRAVVQSASPVGVKLHFTVRDTGIGIPAGKEKSIFDAFSQVDTSVTRRFGGTGLGLAISSRLAELMGGRMWVKSFPGTGSKFHFTAEFGVGVQPYQRTIVPTKALRGLPVLIVDDNVTNRHILGETVSRWGMWPQFAASGYEALELLRNARERGSLPLVLSDLHMPEMDGFTLAAKIQNEFAPNRATIIIFTSGMLAQDEAHRRQLGIAAELTKPVGRSQLLSTILGVVTQRAAPRESPVSRTALSAKQRLRILVADDQAANQMLLRVLLERQGHEVVLAANGHSALAAWESAVFDAILMDVQMPEMDGLQATKTIRDRERVVGGHIPIIAVTASAMLSDQEECFAAGMDAFISKPIRKKDLIDSLATHVKVANVSVDEA